MSVNLPAAGETPWDAKLNAAILGLDTRLAVVEDAPVSGGSTILSGTAAPTNGIGAVGDYYLDTDDRILYGPKLSGAAVTQSVYTTQVPNNTVNTPTNTSYGSDITFASAGNVTGLSYYRHASATTGRGLRMYSSGGALLASYDAPVDTAGWHTYTLTTPVAVTAGQTCRLVVYGNGDFSRYDFTGTIVNGDLTVSGSGVYVVGDAYPGGASSGDYLVDVVFASASAGSWPVALKSPPPGGTTGQALKKLSNTDYAWGWVT